MPDYDVVVVGAGPGGYVAAIRASQLGMRAAVVEQAEVGGICLNWGCIPSKALLRNAELLSLLGHAEDYGFFFDGFRADFGIAIGRSREVVQKLTGGIGSLLRKNNVETIKGKATLQSGTSISLSDRKEVVEAGHIILATGARTRPLDSLPLDGEVVITSREALESKELPDSVVIVGGGATGCEFAYIYNSYGVDVTIVELMPHLLPNEDQDVSEALERSFIRQGIKLLLGCKVQNVSREGDGAVLTVEGPKGEEKLNCGRVLVAVGVQANSDNLGLEEVGIATDRGFIKINEQMRTNVPTVSAIGDVTGKLLLAHVASAQGVTAVEILAGLEPPALDYQFMPGAVYCQPQVTSFGMSEQRAKETGHNVRVGKFPFSASGKAIALGETDGFVKVVVDSEMGSLLGAHLIGPEVTELLAELSMVRLLEGTAHELGWMVHSHPTLSETVKEAALAVYGEAIHI